MKRRDFSTLVAATALGGNSMAQGGSWDFSQTSQVVYEGNSLAGGGSSDVPSGSQ